MYEMPRTSEGGIQHMTSDDVNEQEIWDDTLVMTVLFPGQYGKDPGSGGTTGTRPSISFCCI